MGFPIFMYMGALAQPLESGFPPSSQISGIFFRKQNILICSEFKDCYLAKDMSMSVNCMRSLFCFCFGSAINFSEIISKMKGSSKKSF